MERREKGRRSKRERERGEKAGREEEGRKERRKTGKEGGQGTANHQISIDQMLSFLV